MNPNNNSCGRRKIVRDTFLNEKENDFASDVCNNSSNERWEEIYKKVKIQFPDINMVKKDYKIITDLVYYNSLNHLVQKRYNLAKKLKTHINWQNFCNDDFNIQRAVIIRTLFYEKISNKWLLYRIVETERIVKDDIITRKTSRDDIMKVTSLSFDNSVKELENLYDITMNDNKKSLIYAAIHIRKRYLVPKKKLFKPVEYRLIHLRYENTNGKSPLINGQETDEFIEWKIKIINDFEDEVKKRDIFTIIKNKKKYQYFGKLYEKNNNPDFYREITTDQKSFTIDEYIETFEIDGYEIVKIPTEKVMFNSSIYGGYLWEIYRRKLSNKELKNKEKNRDITQFI